MKTYQDWIEAKENGETLDFIRAAIEEHRSSKEYKTALDADEYEAERNVTVREFEKMFFTASGQQVVDFTASNSKMASNFFHKLTTQRCAYSLGNGISFPSAEQQEKEGQTVTVDTVKERLGKTFDTVLYWAAKYALAHGVSFLMWNLDHAGFFKLTEFVPLFDEEDGRLKAGFRFWSLDWGNRPVTVVVYEPEGYTKYRTKKGGKGLDLTEIEPLRGYVANFEHTEADGDMLTGYSNYSDIPIVPLWGNTHHQSDLIGMRGKIDVYDLVSSGFANTVQDCAEIYWIINNAMGMSDADIAKFRDRLKLQHIAVADVDNAPVTAHTQEIPVTANITLLERTRAQIYEDYGAIDVHTIAAGATNDHIDAAYQSMDDEADDFEYQIIQAVQGILALLGIEDTPVFKRNRISNQTEQTNMVMMAAEHLDEETLLNKLPFLTVDEVYKVQANKNKELMERIELTQELQMEQQEQEMSDMNE